MQQPLQIPADATAARAFVQTVTVPYVLSRPMFCRGRTAFMFASLSRTLTVGALS
jgi:hypothetical protein